MRPARTVLLHLGELNLAAFQDVAVIPLTFGVCHSLRCHLRGAPSLLHAGERALKFETSTPSQHPRQIYVNHAARSAASSQQIPHHVETTMRLLHRLRANDCALRVTDLCSCVICALLTMLGKAGKLI